MLHERAKNIHNTGNFTTDRKRENRKRTGADILGRMMQGLRHVSKPLRTDCRGQTFQFMSDPGNRNRFNIVKASGQATEVSQQLCAQVSAHVLVANIQQSEKNRLIDKMPVRREVWFRRMILIHLNIT